MAMATTFTGSALTPSIQRNHILGGGNGGLLGLRHHAAKPGSAAAHANLLRSISAKLDAVHKQQQTAAGFASSTVLAGAFFAALATSESASAAQQVIDIAAAADNDSRGLALLVPLVPALGWVLFNILQPGLNQLNRMRNAKGVVIGLGAGTLAALALSPHASALSQEIAVVAADTNNDSRGLVLLAVLVPAIAWVLFNILQPGLNQLNRMRSSKVVVGGLGLGAAAAGSLLYTLEADAAQEIATVAEGDNRGLLLLLVIAPAIGWVLFNILQPALNQLNRMRSGK